MISVQLILWIVALILFCIATFPVPSRLNLVAAGLAFAMLGLLAGELKIGD